MLNKQATTNNLDVRRQNEVRPLLRQYLLGMVTRREGGGVDQSRQEWLLQGNSARWLRSFLFLDHIVYKEQMVGHHFVFQLRNDYLKKNYQGKRVNNICWVESPSVICGLHVYIVNKDSLFRRLANKCNRTLAVSTQKPHEMKL
jgi:hypothetical protein